MKITVENDNTEKVPLHGVQYAAFKEGYSFNTLLKGADLRDSLRVKRSGNVIKVAGGKTTATVGMNGAKVCMVRCP